MYVDMVGTAAFHSDVIAYPAITVIDNEPSGPTYIAKKPQIEAAALEKLARVLIQGESSEVQKTTISEGPWTLDQSESLNLVKRLEKDFFTLEDAGCKIGIGVATGADKIYIRPYTELEVEISRKLPLIM